jgi:putative two-component system response regulator
MAKRASILVVDDELGPRESLRMILKPSYEVHTVSGGMEALEFLEKGSVDLITLDLRMPGLSGMELLEQIRQSNPDVLVIIVTGYGTFKSVVEAIDLNVFDYISKPFNVQEIRSVVERCLEMGATRHTIRAVFVDIAHLLLADSSESRHHEIAKKVQELGCTEEDCDAARNAMTPLEFIRVVSNCIEKRDPCTAGHSERVREYTEFMAEKLDLPHSAREALQLVSYLHDIGKVCISSRFMNKEGKLSSTDWAILRKHPIKSVELIEPLRLSREIVLAVRHHHERFDGTGYPDGLAGRDIPLGAQIISIANVYDSLRSKRPHRDMINAAEGQAEIQKYAGAYFDPDLVRAFSEVLKEQEGAFRGRDFQQKLEQEVTRSKSG